MRKLIRNRWFLGTLMVLALGLAIWFIGPAIAIFNYRPLEGTTPRIVLIAVIVAIWLGVELGRLWAARQANKKLLEGIAAGSTEADAASGQAAAEIAQLQERFEAAAKVLKEARFESSTGERQFLYQLPWYVFIGAPGSGKTVAVQNSGLRFPLGDGKGGKGKDEGPVVKGVGGTRNCDWWFTDEAVLLDTAGRFTTQEGGQKTDAASWIGFLDLLKRHRPRRPLNGAIITLSVSDLLSWDDTDRARYADAVRQRVQELYTRLGVRFPLYLMVTKSDLLAGFNEFYTNYGKEERAQVWGMTFPHKTEGTAAVEYAPLFESECQLLEDRLNGILIDRLQQERDQRRRALIYNFPQQFSGLKPLLAEFIASTFQANRYSEQGMLRGLYFTSGTQFGSPIDRVLGTLARSFKLERKILEASVPSGKSFFLTNLLKEVIFPEAGLVGANASLERKLKLALVAGYALVAVLTASLATAWGVSYYRNRALIAEFQTKTATLKDTFDKTPAPRLGDIITVATMLTQLRELGEPYSNSDFDVPWSYTYGLYQGDKLGQGALITYHAALKDVLLPRVALMLEQMLRDRGGAADQYEVLKAYLMLYAPNRLDPKALEEFVVREWSQTFSSTEAGPAVKNLQGHLHTALAKENQPLDIAYPQNAALVAETRKLLASASLPERIYGRLRREAELANVPSFVLSETAGPAAAQVFVRESKKPLSEGVPGMFTVAGYTKAVNPALEGLAQRMLDEESWVIGTKGSGAARAFSSVQLLNDVRRRYFEDYVREWEAFLGDIRLAPSSRMEDTVQFAKLLSGPDSPLRRLMQSAAKETSFAAAGDANPKAGAVKAATDKVVDFARKTLGSNADKAEGLLPVRGESIVEDRFRGLRDFVAASAGNRAPIDRLIDTIREYSVRLDAVADGKRRGDPSAPKSADGGQLKLEAEQAPSPAREVLTRLVVAGGVQVTREAAGGLAEEIEAASAFCRKAVEDRYPFARNAQGEMTLDDFGKVFAPGGDLDDFFKKKLAPLVDTSGAQWRVRPGDASKILSQQTVLQFQRAAAIRDAFYPRGPQAAVSAELALVQIDQRLTHATIEIDNQVLRFDPVATIPQRLSWPSQKPGGRVRLQVYPTGATLPFEGTWALFRLIDKGSPQAGSQRERLQLTYAMEGARLVFDLRASSAVYNPFNLQALGEFKCPRR